MENKAAIEAEEKPGLTKKGTDKKKTANQIADSIRDINVHKLPLEELFAQIGLADPNFGLSDSEAAKKLTIEGENKLTEKHSLPWYVLFMKQLTGFFSLLLWAGAILCFIAYGLNPADASNLWLGVVLAIVVFATGCFAYYQDAKSASIMASFKDMVPPMCNVRREGKETQVPASQIVRGDVIVVKTGVRIPADLRMISVTEMKVDNSSLTGETEPLLRTIECTEPDKVLETGNIAFFGTMCKEGSGVGVVVLTGDNTVIGCIANLAQSAESEETPLRKEVDRFIKLISIIAISLGIIFFVAGFIFGYNYITNIVFAIGIIVANVPEGLLATLTVCLTLTAKKLALKYVLVKNLEAVETLGSTSCICSDKTGTLTQNKMTVKNVWYDEDLYPAINKHDNPDSHAVTYDEEAPTFKMLLRCAVLGSKASWNYELPEKKDLNEKEKAHLTSDQQVKLKADRKEEHIAWLKTQPKQAWPTNGDASETGLIKFFDSIRNIEELREAQPQRKQNNIETEIPFNSTNKFALIIRDPSDENPPEHEGECLLLMKGAPEVIVKRCSKYLKHGKVRTLGNKFLKKFENANAYFANLGQRVLAFAYLWLPLNEYGPEYVYDTKNVNFPLDGLIFIGLCSLEDPPRHGVPLAVKKCQSAGIKVIMVTGDQPDTAQAIARQVNIITAEKTVNDIAKERGISFEEAMEFSDAIVIHGDKINEAIKEDEGIDDPKLKGKRIRSYITKKEVVFARTNPAHKLIIVENCQKIGHVVAVTGDGVNDSPAIKKADIGIAMGVVGSDVAKDAADMLLLTDDFTAIVNGVEEGRLIFDNLKKCICYVLSSNVPEILPFLALIIFQLPLGLTTVLILFIDLGTDIVPSIAMAYEKAELDIMLRKPRNARTDHLVTKNLITFGYLQIGVIQAFGGFYTYFVVFNDLGFKPGFLFYFALDDDGTEPNEDDEFDEDAPFDGNTAALETLGDTGDLVDYNTDENSDIDLRMWYWPVSDNRWGDCNYPDLKSDVTDEDVCWTAEALRHAQTAFFVSIVCLQLSNALIMKTRKLSLFQQGMKNTFMNWGFVSEIAITLFIVYVPPVHAALGTRPLEALHFAVPAMPFFIVIVTYDEIRKLLFRYQSKPDKDGNLPEPGYIQKFTYI
eukprot:CAMPEP_0204898890 /NCGR_PEP_ID=MMETSP1397-20131031/1538_1 /ASSEMBLY_ACC=CAM_ASM_000891 /TAXON_ID=49980 /ORGANISM="Climacostomum Climacostomum virens, Strain Stock W-24" /LENGTH=1138 /DNA_ID=CAMNT_0052066777 /DNA_START=88 /DNA_END=3504 /DNA_ORIENTATION=+